MKTYTALALNNLTGDTLIRHHTTLDESIIWLEKYQSRHASIQSDLLGVEVIYPSNFSYGVFKDGNQIFELKRM